jgi:hypothetical protein
VTLIRYRSHGVDCYQLSSYLLYSVTKQKTVIIRLTGGLGNQLFQYCFGRSLATSRNCKLLFDTTHLSSAPDIHYFNTFIKEACDADLDFVREHEASFAASLIYRWKSRAKRRTRRVVVYEQGLDYRPDVFNSSTHHQYYIGHWQSVRYWKHLDGDLGKELSLKTGVGLPCELPESSVAVHVRLGDFLGSSFHRNLGLEYYASAFQAIRRRIDNPRFTLFSNDRNGACELLKPLNISWQPQSTCRSTIEDFEYMSKHKHFIIANSTFSWWGSYMSNSENRITIAPSVWYNRCKSSHIHRNDMTLL